MGTMKLLNQIQSIRSCPIVGRPMTDERSRSNPRGTRVPWEISEGPVLSRWCLFLILLSTFANAAVKVTSLTRQQQDRYAAPPDEHARLEQHQQAAHAHPCGDELTDPERSRRKHCTGVKRAQCQLY